MLRELLAFSTHSHLEGRIQRKLDMYLLDAGLPRGLLTEIAGWEDADLPVEFCAVLSQLLWELG